jgi:hypothetical protein
MTQPTHTSGSPLRGLLFGVILSLILFPFARHLLGSAIEAVIGIALGVLVVVAIHSFATVRR